MHKFEESSSRKVHQTKRAFDEAAACTSFTVQAAFFCGISCFFAKKADKGSENEASYVLIVLLCPSTFL